MTAKEYVQSIYPEARFVRWNGSQAAISIGTKKEPYLTLGWEYQHDDEDEEVVWRAAKRTIQEMMLEKLQQ